MLHVVQFNAAVEASVVADQTHELAGMPGVRSVAVYEAAPESQGAQGSQTGASARQPRFLVLIDSEEAQDEAVASRIRSGLADYAGEVWSASYWRFRRV